MKTIAQYLSAALLAVALAAQAQPAKPIYENDFEKCEAGKPPADFMIMYGEFAVRQDDTNKVLELPGAPVDSYSVLFGPSQKSGVAVTARVYGTGKSRRFPSFAVGLNGVAGYKLIVVPSRNDLEIQKGDDVMATVPFKWQTDSWTMLRLQVREVGGVLKVEGKAWTQGSPEPAAWTVTFDDKTDVSAGKASLWGSPYSGTPIRYDDVKLTAASDKP